MGTWNIGKEERVIKPNITNRIPELKFFHMRRFGRD
jgi:hypothetical protein